ncbi:ABC transporter ATP-binding protein [Patescibacteria group bacterium]|nr:ABC transporter ATP-binding protein [Patescibacteria group bacterium]
MIKVENLKKHYGDIKALDGISFEVKRGEVLGFLGPNGAGKTTTMKILTGFIAPTSGDVNIDNLDLLADSLAIKEKIGYLPESVPLYTDMKVYEYLKFMAELRGIKKAKLASKIKEIVKVCGLEKVLKQNISELSKGYKQRTALAQAMVHEPDILILDEPTSGLDPNQIVEIRDLIKKIGAQKTVILCTHILQEVQAVCSRVIIINEGKIVAAGTPEELRAKARGQSYIICQIKGAEPDKVKEVLGVIEGVKAVFLLPKQFEQGHGYKIEVAAGGDPREIIFKKVVENNWELLSMNQEQVNLEDIFRELTTN